MVEQRELEKEVEMAKQRIMNRIILENPRISYEDLMAQVYEEMVNPVFEDETSVFIEPVRELTFAEDMDEIDRRNFQSEMPEPQMPQQRNSRSKAVVCITTGKAFASIKEAAAYYGMKSGSGISKCCKGTQRSSGKHNGQKLVWKFL